MFRALAVVIKAVIQVATRLATKLVLEAVVMVVVLLALVHAQEDAVRHAQEAVQEAVLAQQKVIAPLVKENVQLLVKADARVVVLLAALEDVLVVVKELARLAVLAIVTKGAKVHVIVGVQGLVTQDVIQPVKMAAKAPAQDRAEVVVALDVQIHVLEPVWAVVLEVAGD